MTGAALPPQREFLNDRLVVAARAVDMVRRADLAYATIPEGELLLDVYRPAGHEGLLPAVIFLHGDAGAPEMVRHAKDWRAFGDWAALFGAEGLAAIPFGRRSTQAMTRWRDARSDVLTALTFIRHRADDLGIDAERVGLFAFSAGGLWAIPAADHYGRGVRCVALYYPRLGYADLSEHESG